MLVRDYPKQERPVNRVCEQGAKVLSGVDLLAAILQTGNAIEQATAIIRKFGELRNLAKVSIEEICEIEGVGRGQAARIKAAIDLGRRVIEVQPEDRYQIRSPADAANAVMGSMSNLEYESFVILFLDVRNRIIGRKELYKGTINSSLVRVGEVFRKALRMNAFGVIAVHNHPSGDPNPSPEDIALTRRMVQAGKMLEVNLLDHMIIGAGRYVSLRERQIGFEEL